MLTPKFEFSLVDQERGTGSLSSLSQKEATKSSWKIKASFNPLKTASTPLRRSQIVYVTGREGFIVSLTSHGSVLLSSSLSSSQTLTKTGERAIKIMLSSLELFLAIKKTTEEHLRFYKISLDDPSFNRERLLEQTFFLSSELEKIDSAHKIIVIRRQNRTEIWDLDSESSLFTSETGKQVWYSKKTVIQTEDYLNGTLLIVTSLDSFIKKTVLMERMYGIIQVEKIGHRIIVASISSPVHIFDLENKIIEIPSCFPPKFYMETEHMMDAYIVFNDNIGTFAQKPMEKERVRFRNPVFTDTTEYIVVVDDDVVCVLSHHSIVYTSISFGHNVTSVGINEDTNEIYLGQKNGCITILH